MRENLPVTPVQSASLIVVRDGAHGIEVLLLKRNPHLSFAADSLVFPGGSLDEGDRLIASAMRNDGTNLDLLDYRVAAMRESFEEANILHAERHGVLLSQADLRGFKRCRQYLLEGRLFFEDFLRTKQIHLKIDSLRHMAHWVTPEKLKKRFSTQFFLAVQPSNQNGEPDGGEMLDARWYLAKGIEESLDENNRMMLPTRLNCQFIGEFDTVATLLEAVRRREVVSVMPQIQRRGDERWFVIPPEAGYPICELMVGDANTP